jgi:hypothetical protein
MTYVRHYRRPRVWHTRVNWVEVVAATLMVGGSAASLVTLFWFAVYSDCHPNLSGQYFVRPSTCALLGWDR